MVKAKPKAKAKPEKKPKPRFSNNGKLKVVMVKAGDGNKKIYRKDGFDYGLEAKYEECYCCTVAVIPGHIGEWYCVTKEKYMKEPCDIFQIDLCERNTQLKSNWRKRYK